MEQPISLHLKAFNNKVKVMNQTNGRELTLSAVEARNLHTEIFELLAQISELSKIPKEQIPTVTNVEFDGGGF